MTEADDEPNRPARPRNIGPRLPNDPLRYIRRVKRKYQARPYDTVTGCRLNLGTFGTVGEARDAIRKFWWGKLEAAPKYVRKVRRGDGDDAYYAVVPVAGFLARIGTAQRTAEKAAAVAREFLDRFYGPDRAEQMVSGKLDGASVSPRLWPKKRRTTA